MYWMKAKTTRQYSAAFQKASILLFAIGISLIRDQCILGYISDVNLCATLSIPIAISPDYCM
jgi:hypothetical protein